MLHGLVFISSLVDAPNLGTPQHSGLAGGGVYV